MPAKSKRRTRAPKGRRARYVNAGLAAAAASTGLLVVAAPAVATPLLTSLLSEGSSGPAVSKVQRALHLRATGDFTPRTRRAVIAFQRKGDLMVDGIVGPQTWDTLFHIGASATETSNPTGTGDYTIPAAIVECESGGDYSAVNPTSGAGGAYQILPSTWTAYGGQGLPQDAPPAQQNRIAAEIYATQGPSAWTC